MKIFLSLILVLVMLNVSVNFAFPQEMQKKGIDQSLRMGETRETLDPSLFRDPMIREAYRVAKEIPWVLDSIYCYCYCKESPVFRHKSLLSCYADDHAAQ
ncbi:MAG: hypothetical protein HZA09_05960 [Nitrospirae bacterium]|nr:hypothetical protein [Nitrospirota bacterium]